MFFDNSLIKVNMTALESHWGTPDNSVFLGGWCKVGERSEVWEKYQPEVLCNLWTQPQEIEKGVNLCLGLSKIAVCQLGKFIDSSYGLGQGDRFYEKLLTIWVSSFLANLYCRYKSVQEACKGARNYQFITTPEASIFPPLKNPYQWHVEVALSHNLNLYLLSDVVRFLGLPCEERELKPEVTRKYLKEKYSFKRRMFLKAQYFVNALLSRDFYLVGNLYNHGTARALVKPSKGMIIEDCFYSCPECMFKRDEQLRGQTLELGINQFSHLAGELILKYIPLGLLEGAPQYLNLARKYPGSKAKAFLTALDHCANLPWLYLVACSEKPVGIIAHGAYHSVYSEKYACYSETEKQWADRVYDSGDGSYPLPNLALYSLSYSIQEEHLESKQERLLIVGDVHFYYDRLECVLPESNASYEAVPEKEYRFFGYLEESVPVEYRLFLKPRGMKFYEKIRMLHPNISFHGMLDKPFAQAVNESRLVCIINSNWTSLTSYELLCANKPCVIIYQEPQIPVTDKMQSVMDVLASAGVVHFTVEAAAVHINAIFDTADEWWNSDVVQKAREVFIDKFARPVDNWPQKYFTALQQLAEGFEKKDTRNE